MVYEMTLKLAISMKVYMILQMKIIIRYESIFHDEFNEINFIFSTYMMHDVSSNDDQIKKYRSLINTDSKTTLAL